MHAYYMPHMKEVNYHSVFSIRQRMIDNIDGFVVSVVSENSIVNCLNCKRNAVVWQVVEPAYDCWCCFITTESCSNNVILPHFL